MEDKSLIARKPLNGNRRSLYVYLTDLGKELAKRVNKEFDNIEKKPFPALRKRKKRN